MTKRVLFGEDLRKVADYAMKIMSSAVESTLGPSGKLALLDRGKHIPSTITKDGVTVARNVLPLEDTAANKVGEKILEICTKTNEEAGDGTTTAIVLAKALYRQAQKVIKEEKVDPVALKEQIEEVLPIILKKLDEMSSEVKGLEDMINVASISANNDRSVGEVVARAIEMVGEDGHVTLEEGDSIEPKLSMIEGYQIEKGTPDIRYLKGRSSHRFDKPYFLVYNGNISDANILVNIITSYTQPEGRPLIVISDVGKAVASFMLSNMTAGACEVIHVPPPMYKNTRQKYLKDIAVAVGAELIEPGDTYAYSIKKEQLGQAESVTVTQWKTTVVGGSSKKQEVLSRIEEIKREMEDAPSPYDANICKERIGKLTAGVCVISVGGKTEQEMVERKDRFEDSLNATRAALQEGIIPGGGHALYVLSKTALAATPGARVLQEAIKEPIQQIIRNAGRNCDEILKEITTTKGYDAKAHRFCNLVDCGIIDPVKVTKLALQNAVSVVDLLINLEVLSYEIPQDKTMSVLGKLASINPEDVDG